MIIHNYTTIFFFSYHEITAKTSEVTLRKKICARQYLFNISLDYLTRRKDGVTVKVHKRNELSVVLISCVNCTSLVDNRCGRIMRVNQVIFNNINKSRLAGLSKHHDVATNFSCSLFSVLHEWRGRKRKQRGKNWDYKNMALEVCYFVGLSHDVNWVNPLHKLFQCGRS